MVKTIRDAFELYASKAPIKTPLVRTKAFRTQSLFWGFITTDERLKLSIALAHSDTGKGRTEFDQVCIQVRKRLFKDTIHVSCKK